MKQDRIKTSIFPAATMYYTQYQGKRCALPLLADVYGFYYNKAMFAAAGLKGPPKTLGELTTYAKKLTTKNADGSLKVVGYNPFFGFYQNTAGAYQPLVNGKWFDSSGKSSLGKDPAWAKLLALAEEPHRLLRPQEPGQVERGRGRRVLRLARLRDRQARDDDRRRVARRVHRGRASRAEVRHRADARRRSTARPATARATSTARSSASRRTRRTRTRRGRSSKYLTTNDHALAQFSNGIRNVPSTKAAASRRN